MATVVLQKEETNYPKTDHFIPERWLKEIPNELECPSAKSTNPFVYLPFGFGPRSCVGRRFAEMEVEVLLTRSATRKCDKINAEMIIVFIHFQTFATFLR